MFTIVKPDQALNHQVTFARGIQMERTKLQTHPFRNSVRYADTKVLRKPVVMEWAGNGHFYWNTHKKIARKLSKKDGVLNIDKISKDERLRYLKLAREGYNSIIDPPKEDLPKIHKDPKTKSISVPRETYPKEGYVYIFQDMMKPEGVYKIGSTDDVGSRLSNARTWGEFQCVRWFYSDDCKVLERNTHHELSEFKIKKDHMGDEWFQIAEDAAIHKIQELSNASTAV